MQHTHCLCASDNYEKDHFFIVSFKFTACKLINILLFSLILGAHRENVISPTNVIQPLSSPTREGHINQTQQQATPPQNGELHLFYASMIDPHLCIAWVSACPAVLDH